VTATAQAVLNVHRSQIGTRETPVNLQKYGSWYGMNGVPWCDEYQSWCAAQAGAQNIIWRSASVQGRLNRARALGLTVTSPRPGDLACFDWNSDHVADHIEIVENVLSDTYLQTIGGNTRQSRQGDEGVWRMNRWTGNVLAYIRPQYGAAISTRPAPAPIGGTRPLVVDGAWGPMTTRHLQLVMHMTPVDGVFGPRTVMAMQRWLRQAATGRVDLRTRTALQHRVGVQADGVIGPQTVRAFQKYLNRAV
jgi:peptidoglycan hydrolase-like protein with peptidoglycan-binding domain